MFAGAANHRHPRHLDSQITLRLTLHIPSECPLVGILKKKNICGKKMTKSRILNLRNDEQNKLVSLLID